MTGRGGGERDTTKRGENETRRRMGTTGGRQTHDTPDDTQIDPMTPTTASTPHHHRERLLVGCIWGARAWEQHGGTRRQDEGEGKGTQQREGGGQRTANGEEEG